MKVAWGVLADYAAEMQSGKLLVAGEFDSLTAVATPVRHLAMYLVVRLEGVENEPAREVIIRLYGPNGQQVPEPMIRLPDVKLRPAVVPGTARIQLLVGLSQIVFPAFGLYKFSLTSGEEHLGAVPILIKQGHGDPR